MRRILCVAYEIITLDFYFWHTALWCEIISLRNLRNYFWNDSPTTSSKNKKPIIVKESQEVYPRANDHSTSIKIKPTTKEIDMLLDVNNMRLALSKATLMGRIKDGIPIIRSATNIPRIHPRRNKYMGRLMREELPVIRSPHSASDNISVIRSATNVPKTRRTAIHNVSPLMFLASRI